MENNHYHQEEMHRKVFAFVYGCAMHDAILQKAFPAEDKKWIGEEESAKDRLRAYIDQVLQNSFVSQDDHDRHFLATANDICTCINNSKHKPAAMNVDFSFGNAQKLINITVKHVYSVCYYNAALRKGFQYCHCPVDRIMLGKVWEMYKDATDRKTCAAKLGTKEQFCTSWGKEGLETGKQPLLSSLPERYVTFQQTVRTLIGEGDICPIEFDYINWKSAQ